MFSKILAGTGHGEKLSGIAKAAALLAAGANYGRFVPRSQRGQAGFEGEMATPPASLAQLSQYGVFRPDAIEVVRQPLYDRIVYDDAGTALMQFFQVPQGQGNSSATGGAGLVKTLEDTNMEAAGQLPSPKAFLATSLELIVEAGSISTANAWSPQDIAFLTNASAASVGIVPQLNAVNDVNRLLIGSVVDFFIGSKSYLTNARGDSFPPKSYVCPDAAVAQSVQLGHSGVAAVRAVGRPFYLNPPVLLMPNTNFVVRLMWPAAVVATPTGQNARITCRLDGFLYRNAQ
jgi:hypothetical protein